MSTNAQATGGGARWSPGDPGFDEKYRAIDARDTRFDGQFFTAVSSTGIYCRPSCPARTPKPENVSFYLTSAAAHRGGYRACKRCLPEATPGTPDWDLRSDTTARAMRLIIDGVVDRDGVDGLATLLGYSTRHVDRLLLAELGAGPLALARARRAQTARSLLAGTDLSMADVAFASGFGSVRQFNDTILEVFDARPGELRDRARGGGTAGARQHPITLFNSGVSPTGDSSDCHLGTPVRLDLDLPVRQPFDAPGVFSFLAARAITGVESVDLPDHGPLRYARTLDLPHGPGAIELVATWRADSRWSMQLRLELTSLADLATAVTRARRMVDLDADPVAVDAALSTDPNLATLVAKTPGIRLPGTPDPHELVVRAIVGQQITVTAARGHLGRLAAALGTRYSSTFTGLDTLFPSPAQLVAGVPEPNSDGPLDPDRPLRLPRRSISTVLDTARALADGTLVVDVGSDPAALRADLVARPGIGPWTAAYVAMRVLGDPDSWLVGDVALVAGAQTAGALPGDLAKPAAHRALAAHATKWAPWRSYAAMHLWAAAIRT